MKLLKALLFLTVVGLSQAAVRSLTEPHPDCPTSGHYLLPHEYDCTKFYYCDRGQKFVNPTNCPPNTEFSEILQVCTHVETSGCTLPGPSTVYPPQSTSSAPTDAPNDSTTPGYTELLENGCPADSNVHMLLAHENLCSKFYSCVHGEKVLRSCGPGTVFNPDIQVCDHPFNVDRDCEEDESKEDIESSSSENESIVDDSGSISNENESSSSSNEDEIDSNSKEDDNSISNEDIEDDSNENEDSGEIELQPNGCPIELSMSKYLPHEHYCSKSYECVYGSVEDKSCPTGTHFSYELLVSLSEKKKPKNTYVTLKICVIC